MKQFSHLVFAGTFDRLHVGHKELLDMAFELGEIVSIGITTEKLYNSKPLANLISTWQVRKRAVEQYLRERNWLKRTRFFKLDDIYGPSIVDKTIDSILVTELTKANAKKVNKIRVKKGLPTLRFVVAPLVLGEDGEAVTSEKIRMGEMDREGYSYQLSVVGNRQIHLKLPRNLREELRKPLGMLIKSQIPISKNQTNPKSQSPNNKILRATAKKTLNFINRLMPTMVITVGDIVTISLLEVGFVPNISVVDLKSRRKPIGEERISRLLPTRHGRDKLVIFEVGNDAGTINLQAVRKVQMAVKGLLYKNSKCLIKVKGEEDLLALPAILLAPLHSIVLYGQMDMGIVMVEVTEEKKKEVMEILKKFY